MTGACYSAISCRHLGGVPIGKCGTANVCCVCTYTLLAHARRRMNDTLVCLSSSTNVRRHQRPERYVLHESRISGRVQRNAQLSTHTSQDAQRVQNLSTPVSTLSRSLFAFPIHALMKRFDFTEFDLLRPTMGTCDADRFMVSGVNSNSVVPNICGYNSGQHSKRYVTRHFETHTHIERMSSLRGRGRRQWSVHGTHQHARQRVPTLEHSHFAN